MENKEGTIHDASLLWQAVQLFHPSTQVLKHNGIPTECFHAYQTHKKKQNKMPSVPLTISLDE